MAICAIIPRAIGASMDLVCAGTGEGSASKGMDGISLAEGSGEGTNNSSSNSTSESPVAETNSSRSISAMASSSFVSGQPRRAVPPVPLSTELLPLVDFKTASSHAPTRYRHAEVRMAASAATSGALKARREDRPSLHGRIDQSGGLCYTQWCNRIFGCAGDRGPTFSFARNRQGG